MHLRCNAALIERENFLLGEGCYANSFTLRRSRQTFVAAVQ